MRMVGCRAGSGNVTERGYRRRDTGERDSLISQAIPAYEVGAELGRGAFGVVFVGCHRELGREVAIKQLPRAYAADPEVRDRFGL